MSKKWYEYFVSVEGEGQPEPPGSAPRPPAANEAARAIAEIAATVAAPPPPARFDKPVAAAAAGTLTNFDEIYSAADIRSVGNGFSIFKVADMLSSEHIKAMPAEMKKGSVMLALDAAGVKIHDIIQDAVRRDQALDAFERVHQKAVDDLESRKTQENQKLQADLDKFVAEQKAKMQSTGISILGLPDPHSIHQRLTPVPDLIRIPFPRA
ncbi:MAG: hypothetical protein FJW30_03235, partial [Acidobacteria bacterium]|nr:hypothetical protein [Acidobacteriota bacterium]